MAHRKNDLFINIDHNKFIYVTHLFKSDCEFLRTIGCFLLTLWHRYKQKMAHFFALKF